MPHLIEIKIADQSIKAELNNSEAALEIIQKLALNVNMSRWGDEYYGSCGLNQGLSGDAKVIMEVGELAVWPAGNALCIFFGATPVSTDSRPRAASEVNPVGKVLDNPDVFKKFGHSITAEITLSK